MFSTIIEVLAAIRSALQSLEASATASARAGATGCGCPGGTTGPSGEGIEGEDPPDGGWEDTEETLGTSEYDARKCTVANLVHEWVVGVTSSLESAGVDHILNALLTGGFSLAASYIVAALTGLIFGWVFLVLGAVVAIISVLVANTVNLTDLGTALSTYEDDFVCALVNAESTGEARTDYVAVAAANGVSAANQAFLSALFTVDDVLNTLFFSPLFDRGAELEAAIAAHTGGVDCDVACAPPWWDCSFGTVLDYDATFVEIRAEASGSDYLVYIGIDAGADIQVSQVGHTTPGDAAYFTSAWDTGENRCGQGGGSPWTNVTANNFADPNGYCHGALYRSNTQCTMTYTLI